MPFGNRLIRALPIGEVAKRNRVGRWLELARDAHVAAGKMRDAEPTRTMLEIAANYELLAKHAERLPDVPPVSVRVLRQNDGAQSAGLRSLPCGRRWQAEAGLPDYPAPVDSWRASGRGSDGKSDAPRSDCGAVAARAGLPSTSSGSAERCLPCPAVASCPG